MPRKQDKNPNSAASISFHAFYRKAVIEVRDALITEYDNLKLCLEKMEPLANFVRPPLKSLDMGKMNEISSLFPPSITVNAECLHAESEIFRSRVEKSNDPCKTVEDVCQQVYFNKSIFPNVYKTFKLLFSAPVTVAKDEQTFSRMKIVKNFLRSTMSDTRLDDLIVLASEKDLVDSIDLNAAVKKWASQKNRKLKIKIDYNSDS